MPIIQKGLHESSKLIKRFLGVHPIINFFIDQLNIGQIISSCIKQDARLVMPLDQSLILLVHNILASPMPMYEISDWSKTLDEENVGLGENESELINDDRIGRALSSFYKGKHKDVFFRLALKTIKIHKLNCDHIHQDTTSITLSGKYPSQEAYEKIAFGKNKDHRPDLKQLVLGLSVTADGAVPLVHKVYNGNQTDDTLHIENHRKLVKLLQRTDFVYVADSKLATESNLDSIASCNGKFISIMPRTWREDKEFKELIQQGAITWKHVVSKKKNNIRGKKFDRYYLAEGNYRAKSKYRLIWFKSSQKVEHDEEARERRIQKCIEEINILSTKLNKRKLKTRANIKNNLNEIFKKNKCSGLINFKITSTRIYNKRKKISGRETNQWRNIFIIAFGRNDKAIEEETKEDGIFPLITNLPDEKKAKEILGIYKFQAFLETRNHQLKEWQMVSPALLKNAKRIVAYLHMHVIALIVSSLIERKLRQGIKKTKIKSLPIYPEERECASPTFYDLCRLFRGIEKYEVTEKNNVTYFPAILNSTQKKVLELLGIPISLYQ